MSNTRIKTNFKDKNFALVKVKENDEPLEIIKTFKYYKDALEEINTQNLFHEVKSNEFCVLIQLKWLKVF
ncbi:hypothetical protein [Mycoplasma sp. 125]|uniref:hypothetical protein n=1 Tax=Mycoplasma sp. 125 TaxID=3447505 RepID=UPI003F654CFA